MNGNLAGTGGTGIWDLNTVTWFDPVAAPGNEYVVWNNTGIALRGDTIAEFNADSTVTVDNGAFIPGDEINTGGLQFTGGTTHSISGGTLTLKAVGALGDTPIIFANPGITATISTKFTGNTGLVIDAFNSAIIMSGANTYTGLTLVRAGTLELNAGAGSSIPHDLTIGDGSLNAGNGDARVRLDAAFQLTNATNVTVQKDGVFDLNGNNVNIGKLTVYENSVNGGLVQLKGATLIVDGTLELRGGQIADVAGGSFLTANGNIDVLDAPTIASIGSNITLTLTPTTVITVDQSSTLVATDPELAISAHTSNTNQRIYKDGAGTLRLSNAVANEHTGGTFVANGTLELASTTIDGAVPGDLTIGDGTGSANSAIAKLINDNQIAPGFKIVINSDGLLDLNTKSDFVGSVSGSGNISVFNGGQLRIVDSGANTFSGVLIGNAAGFISKQGTGTMTISGASAGYQGQFEIAAGTLRTTNNFALGTGTTQLKGGTLSIGGPLTVGTFEWSGGDLGLAPGLGDKLIVSNAFTKLAGGPYIYLINPTGLQVGTYDLTSFNTTNFTLADYTLQFDLVNANIQAHLEQVGNTVQLVIDGATASGATIQNSAPVNTPTFADFTVSGQVQTGGPTENNIVNSLIFTPGSSLFIHNNLTASTSAPTNLVGGSTITLDSSRPSSLTARQLNVLFGALLNGSGVINGNLTNSGTVSPGNSPGYIGVTQDYRQTSSGTLRIEIGGRRSGEFDLLAVGGRAFLDGKLELVRLNRFELRRGDKITFLTANQGVQGEFASISNPFDSNTILEPTVVYDDREVSLELVRGSFADHAKHEHLTPNQRATARTLDSVSTEEANHKALVYLDYRDLNDLAGDFDRIAPEELSSIFSISTSGVTVQNTNLQRRTDDIRSGANGFSAAGLAINGQTPSYSGGINFRTGAAGPTGGDSKESKEVKTVVEEEKRWGAFLSGTGEWVDVDGDGNARGFDLTSGGFTLGLDYKVSANFALGILAGYTGTTADLTNDGRVWVNGGKAGLYSTYFTGGFYLDAAVTGGYNSYDTKRDALQGAARGSTEGGELNALAGIGYDWKIGALTIGPTATFNYTLVGMDGFTEHGSLAPLDIDRRNAESIRSAVGFRASYDWKCGGVIIKPEVRAAWQHEYGDKSYDISASFAGGDGDHFLVNGPEIGRDSLLLGAGFAIQFSESCSTYFYYDGELGRDRYDRNSVTGGVRIAF